MDKKNRIKWTNKFRTLGKKKGSRQDFIKLYKEMKKEKDKNNEIRSETGSQSWKDFVKDDEK